MSLLSLVSYIPPPSWSTSTPQRASDIRRSEQMQLLQPQPHHRGSPRPLFTVPHFLPSQLHPPFRPCLSPLFQLSTLLECLRPPSTISPAQAQALAGLATPKLIFVPACASTCQHGPSGGDTGGGGGYSERAAPAAVAVSASQMAGA